MLTRRRLTLLIIPEEGGRTYEYKVPRMYLWLVAAVGVGIFALLIIGLESWADARFLSGQVERLERDKAILTEEVELIEELEIVLRELESKNEQLRAITSEVVGLRGTRAEQRVGRVPEKFISVNHRLRYGSLHTVPTLAPVRAATWKPFGQGVLLPVPRGSLVRAAADGRVSDTDFDRDIGFGLTVDHGNGLLTTYAGIGTMIVAAGDYVQKGQPLGLTTLPRDGTTPGLRFQVVENGRESTARYQRIWL